MLLARYEVSAACISPDWAARNSRKKRRIFPIYRCVSPLIRCRHYEVTLQGGPIAYKMWRWSILLQSNIVAYQLSESEVW